MLLLFTTEGEDTCKQQWHQITRGCFFDSQSDGTYLFAFYESLRTIQLKIMFNVLLKKAIYILDGLGVSKLTKHIFFSFLGKLYL